MDGTLSIVWREEPGRKRSHAANLFLEGISIMVLSPEAGHAAVETLSACLLLRCSPSNSKHTTASNLGAAVARRRLVAGPLLQQTPGAATKARLALDSPEHPYFATHQANILLRVESPVLARALGRSKAADASAGRWHPRPESGKLRHQ